MDFLTLQSFLHSLYRQPFYRLRSVLLIADVADVDVLAALPSVDAVVFSICSTICNEDILNVDDKRPKLLFIRTLHSHSGVCCRHSGGSRYLFPFFVSTLAAVIDDIGSHVPSVVYLITGMSMFPKFIMRAEVSAKLVSNGNSCVYTRRHL